MKDYQSVIAAKRRQADACGFSIDDSDMHPSLFDHQRAIVKWAARVGRCAIFADTGLGKTRMQLDWARLVSERTSRPVLVLAPLAVGDQTLAEAADMGLDACWAESGDSPIRILNYDRLHRIDPACFAGVVLDESSILKAYDGKTRVALTEAFADTTYRLACSATPAPNDHTELGTHAAFLGVCTREEMLAEYFVHDGGDTSKWRLKGHARTDFWRWVSSWAVMVRKPSDLGFENGRYDLPPLRLHTVTVEHHREVEDGMLFAAAAMTLTDQRRVRRDSLADRCAAVAELIDCEPDERWLVWCELNDEGDELERLIPGSIQVAGSTSSEAKRDAMIGFARGEVPVLITKAKIAGFGMNWQKCARMAFVGTTHSYEQWYQAVRRCWRFGQTREVVVYMVETTADTVVSKNLARKTEKAAEMAAEMARMVRDHQLASVFGRRPANMIMPGEPMRIPGWLGGQND